MLVVRISSGFGNQLFQYAFALYLKAHYEDMVYLDKSSYKYRTTTRVYSLDILSDLPVISDKRIYYNYRPIFLPIFKALFDINPLVQRVDESNLHFPPNNKFLYFDGFWQTDSFINQIPDYKSYFRPKEPIPDFIDRYLEEIHQSYSISIHVRRGDYFSDAQRHKFGICNTDYYERAIRMLTGNVSDYKLFVFSDDLDWVKINIKLPENCVFINNENSNPWWYIYLMSNCRDNIISNSSFSWWGAYLNENRSKKVIAPDKWMIGSEKNIALDDWIKI
jgi:hypothetical protein